MVYKNIFFSLSLIIIISFLSWTSFVLFRPQDTKPLNVDNRPDALMENVTALILDKQGKPKLKVITPKLVHFPSGDTTRFTSPQLTLYRHSPKPWFITSQYAKASQGIENIDFWDHVIIHHAADENNPATIIKTSMLTVFPNKNLAQTTQHITMTQPSLVVKAIGMHANLKTGDIKLLSQARGEYVPSS